MLDSEYTPPPCRVLMSGGQWAIPEAQRPADWRDREQAKEAPEAKAKTPWLYVEQPKRQPAKPRGFQAGHPKYGGKVAGTMRRIVITAGEIAARMLAGETIEQIAAVLKCHPSVLYIRMQTAGVALPNVAKCHACGKPTDRSPQAKYCRKCVKLATSESIKRANAKKALIAPKCTTEGCNRRGTRARGLCSACYQRPFNAARRAAQV